VALLASLCALVLLPVTPASADRGQSQPTTQEAVRSILQERVASSAPRIWHVLVGGQSEDQAIQAEGYYPRVITIDAGDTVVWTLNTAELHSVTFTGTCGDISCVPPCVFVVNPDISPCGPTSYDGVSAIASSGRMVAAGYNWNSSYPHGDTTYSLTFTNAGVNVYFDLSVSGMRGVVIVNPAGTPYPFTQTQYSEQARDQLQSDLEAGARARKDFQPIATSTNPDGTNVHHVALGTNPPETARVVLHSMGGSDAKGTALLDGSGVGPSPNPTIAVKISLSGLRPGSVHAVQILLGVCGSAAPTTGLIFSGIFAPPIFTLNKITAGPDGRATVATVLTQPPNLNGPGQLRIPSAGWFVNVAGGSTADGGATSVACGNVVFQNASVVRYLPRSVRVRVGDTVEWSNDTINEVHGVTFLAGQPLPLIPDWFMNGPSGNPTSYAGSTLLNSGPLYGADAGRNHSFAVTFTRAGTFPYVDVGDAVLGMRGTVVVVAWEVSD
jgi:plastocyanin